jgi:O-acetyl-ADP-ribose deacetylase (regulator of RNase III)
MLRKEIISCITITKGDITAETTDAIVNAANTSLLGGGGVDGAIHNAAGPGLLEECRKLNECKPGEARITKGYNLNAKFVIHTPGPIYKDGQSSEPEILRSSYWNSMLLVKENNLKSVSFPAISTGVYKYPKAAAAEIAIETVITFIEKEQYPVHVSFILFDNDNYQIYSIILEGKKNDLY